LPCPAAPIPFGSAARLRPGRDVTLIAHSHAVRIALEAAELLAGPGISCEVLDLRSVAPLDAELICESVSRTHRLVTVEEGQVVCGVGAEVAFRVQERLGPIPAARVGARPVPVSSNPRLEAHALPDAGRVVEAVRKLLSVSSNSLAEPGA
jgi:pyruvate dehydrogenase E1 component beta subunit